MNIGQHIKKSSVLLKNSGIETATLDVLILLEDILNVNRAQLLAHPDSELTIKQQKILGLQIKRRKNHEPLAYIRGKTEFYGHEFMVNKHVLQPRPESETMIDMLKKLNLKTPKIADIGTGSGVLAITAKLEITKAQIIAIDIDKKALDVARQNARKHKVTVKFLQGNLLEPIYKLGPKTGGLVLLCNLPYVPNNFHTNLSVGYEPKHAIFGGSDGLDLYRELFNQLDPSFVSQHTVPYILTESLPVQHKALARIAQKKGYALRQTTDFIQLYCYAKAQNTSRH